MSPPSGRLHYSSWVREGYTLCGRVIKGSLRVTPEVGRITCIMCKGSPALDGLLGNMTHAGH